MQLGQITKVNEGIDHFEDLAIQDFLNAMRNFEQFEISEKIDGSNLQFGYDEEGFYTLLHATPDQNFFIYKAEIQTEDTFQTDIFSHHFSNFLQIPYTHNKMHLWQGA